MTHQITIEQLESLASALEADLSYVSYAYRKTRALKPALTLARFRRDFTALWGLVLRESSGYDFCAREVKFYEIERAWRRALADTPRISFARFERDYEMSLYP